MPMVLRLSDRAIETSLMQLRNASSPMEVTLLGRVSEVRKVQSLNDDLPIDVSDEGRLIETKVSQPSKAESPMEVVPSGTVAWPFASGVYRQPAVTPPSASRTKVASLMGPLIRAAVLWRAAVKRRFFSCRADVSANYTPLSSRSLRSRLMPSGCIGGVESYLGPPLPMFSFGSVLINYPYTCRYTVT